jgi:hypothetical protein
MLYDKNSESDYFFFLHQNQNIFFSNIGNQNICLENNHNPPFNLNRRQEQRITRETLQTSFLQGTGYEYDGNVFVAWVLQVRRAEVVTK